jgi:hypothetical protein
MVSVALHVETVRGRPQGLFARSARKGKSKEQRANGMLTPFWQEVVGRITNCFPERFGG